MEPSVYIHHLINGANAQVLNFINAQGARIAAGRSFAKRDPGGSVKVLYSHGWGSTAHNESLLKVHHKTCSEILCPKLCTCLFCLFGDC